MRGRKNPLNKTIENYPISISTKKSINNQDRLLIKPQKIAKNVCSRIISLPYTKRLLGRNSALVITVPNSRTVTFILTPAIKNKQKRETTD